MSKISVPSMKPHQKEIVQAAWRALGLAEYCFVYGGKGTFKTSTLTLVLFHQLRYLSTYYKGLRFVVGAMTLKQVKEAFLEAWKEQVPASEFTYRERQDGSRIIYLTKTGPTEDSQAQISLLHTSDARAGRAAEKESRKKRGGNIHGFYFPQAESVSRPFFNEIESRVRGEPEKKMQINGQPFAVYPNFNVKCLDANPDVPEHWLYRLFLDPTSGVFIGHHSPIVKVKTTAETSAYTSKQLAGFRVSWEKHEIARMLDAEWVGASGLVFKNFDSKEHCKDFDPDPSWTWFLGVDFGYRAPFCALWIGLDKEGHCWVFDEIYLTEMEIPDLAAMIYTRHPTLKLDSAIVDNNEPNAYKAMQRFFREQGGFLRVLPTRKGPGSVDNRLGICRKWLTMDSRGQARITFHKTNCPNLRSEVLSLEYEPRAEGDLKAIKEQPQQAGKDHAIDAWSYPQVHIDALVSRMGIKN